MSDPASALMGETHQGFATVAEAGLAGMVSLRGDLSAPALAEAVRSVTGAEVPAPRRIARGQDGAALWMSPDELLLMMPYGAAPSAVAALETALAGSHHLAVDVSDARAVFRVTGEKADEVLMKLCPVDFAGLGPDEVRRTRAAQVAAALWRSGPGEITIVTFRSVAGYVMGLLEVSSRPGSELFPA